MHYCKWQEPLQSRLSPIALSRKESTLYEMYHSSYMPRGINSRNNLEHIVYSVVGDPLIEDLIINSND
jgi:hypothetical protein